MSRKDKKVPLFTKGKMDYIILFVVLIILSCGLIMVLSASAPSSLSESGDSYKYFRKQAFCAGIGCVAMLFASKVDYRKYKKFTWIIYIGVIAILLVTAKFGIEEKGARRWLSIGSFSFQPSEFAKIGLVIFFASILTDIKKAGNITHFFKGFCVVGALLLPIVLILYKGQNHLSVTLLIIAVTGVQMFVIGVPFWHFVVAGALGAGAFVGYKGIKTMFMTPEALAEAAKEANNGFRKKRLEVWLDPFSDATGKGWQTIQSLYAIASGGLFGLGFGESRQKYLYLPEPHNDFIFSVLAEELGFFGCSLVILFFAILIWRGIIVAMKAPDSFGSLIAIGITVLIGLQTIINIAVVTGAIPVTGMPLPFFSYGGTALIVNLATMGILLNISRSCNQK